MNALQIIALVFGLPLLGHLWYWWWSAFNPPCPVCPSHSLLDHGRLGGYRFGIDGAGSDGMAACWRGHVYHAPSGVVCAHVKMSRLSAVVHDDIEMATAALIYDDQGGRHNGD